MAGFTNYKFKPSDSYSFAPTHSKMTASAAAFTPESALKATTASSSSSSSSSSTSASSRKPEPRRASQFSYSSAVREGLSRRHSAFTPTSAPAGTTSASSASSSSASSASSSSASSSSASSSSASSSTSTSSSTISSLSAAKMNGAKGSLKPKEFRSAKSDAKTESGAAGLSSTPVGLGVIVNEKETKESDAQKKAGARRGMNRDKAFVADHYKTEICRSHRTLGYCEYEDNCQFAHGIEELRPRRYGVKYKTQMCKNYHVDGHCRFGSRCKFIHDEQRIQVGEREFWLISPSENLVRVEVVENSQRASQLRALIEAEQQRLQQMYQQNNSVPPTIRPHLYPPTATQAATATASSTPTSTSGTSTPTTATAATATSHATRMPQLHIPPHSHPIMPLQATSPLPSTLSPTTYYTPTFYSPSPSPDMSAHTLAHLSAPPLSSPLTSPPLTSPTLASPLASPSETQQGPLFTLSAVSSPTPLTQSTAQSSPLPVYGYNISSPLVNVPYSLDYHLQNLSLIDPSFLGSPMGSHSPSPQPILRAFSSLPSSLPGSLPGSLPPSLPGSLPSSLPSTPPSVARRLQHLKSITTS